MQDITYKSFAFCSASSNLLSLWLIPPEQDQYEFPSDENYINFICVHNLPFEMLLCVCCSNIVAANTIVPQFSILALSISIKNTPYKMLANNNIE